MNRMRRAPKSAATIDELRAQIARGRYEVKSERVAEAMLRRGLFRLAPPKARPG